MIGHGGLLRVFHSPGEFNAHRHAKTAGFSLQFNGETHWPFSSRRLVPRVINS